MTTPGPDYSALPLPELKALCRERGLRVSGRADELAERLRDDDAARAADADRERVKAAAAVPAPVEAARELERRIGWLGTNAGATLARAQQRVEEAARRLIAAVDLGLDDAPYLRELRADLARLDEAAAEYVTAARRALGG